jgi:hypothetical protein
MNTGKLLPFISLLILQVFSSCSNKEDNLLIGKWEPAVRPNNIGNVLEFGPDSLYNQITEARVNYKYKYEGDTLISISRNNYIKDNGELESVEIIDSASITISGDTLTLIRGEIGDQQMTVMKRLDSVYTNKDGIVGFWVWPHQSGRNAISEYHPDGKASVSVLIDRKEGKYFVNGKNDSLTVMVPGSNLRDIYFEIKGDTLLFPDKFAPLGKAFYRVKKK